MMYYMFRKSHKAAIFPFNLKYCITTIYIWVGLPCHNFPLFT